MIWWNGDFCIENEDRNHMIWWKGDNEGEDQTCSLCRWDQAPWKCGQAVREQSLPGEQSPWNRQYHNYGQLSIGCLQSEVPPEVLPGSVVGHSCWTFGSDYLHSWKYTVLIFSSKLSGPFDIWRNISAAITSQCIVSIVSKKTEFSRNQLWEIFFWLVRNPIGLLFWQIQLCYYRTMCFNVIVICSIWAI